MGRISASLLPLLFILILASEDERVKYYTEVVERGTENARDFEFPTNAYTYKPTNREIHDFGTYDFIIVGAGTAGCVVANRLTEIADWNVLLVEAGDYGDDFVDIPFMHGLLYYTKYNWGYYTTPQTTSCLGMVNKECNFPRGKGVGGSSLINGLMYVRGNRWDFNHWAELGNKEWSYDRVLPYFRKAETFKNGSKLYHGFHGPMHVEYTTPHSQQCITFVEANKEMGQEVNPDYNGEEQLGVAFIQFNNIDGHREDTGKAYIKPFLNRKNLHVQTNSYVTKIVLEDDYKTSRGIQFTYNGKTYIANAKKEVIVAAGAINSPQILMLSGIGPREELEKFDIPQHHELPVGKNLMDHAACFFLNFEMDYREPDKSTEELVKEFLQGVGLYTIAGNTQAIGFLHTKLAQVPDYVPDVEFIISTSPTITEFTQRSYHFTNETYEALFGNKDPLKLFRVFVIVLHPHSVGSIRLQSANPFDYPLIDSQYLSDPNGHDIATMYEGIKYILSLLETKVAKKRNVKLVSDELPACKHHEPLSEDYWYCYIRQTTQDIYHPMGTNKMGQDQKTSVVNSRLKVHGLHKLRVADASVFPASVSGHTSATSVMTGEMVSDFIKEEYLKGQ